MSAAKFVKFKVISADGVVVRTGMCAATDVLIQAINPGETAVPDTDTDTPVVIESAEGLETFSYSSVRASMYPAVTDQLDALWKFFATQTDIPQELKEMSDRVASVKAQVPKDNTKYIRDPEAGDSFVVLPN